MLGIRLISSKRWRLKKKKWIFLGCLFFFFFVRVSKGSIYKDFYYFISKPFWPGEFQKEIILNSFDKELKIKLIQLEKDNARLRSLLSLQNSSNEKKITSAVISRNNGSWWKQLILNKGSRDGVEKGDAVVGPGGLLGVIDDVSYLTSSVKLLTSFESKVGVWVQRNNLSGLLIGIGSDSPQLIFYSKDVDVNIGDHVLSSPASTVLPPNIPIGIITYLDIESKPITTAKVQLIAKPHAIDWVEILKLENK